MRPKIFRIFDENDQSKVRTDACLSLLPAVTYFDPALLEYAENFTRIQLRHDGVLSNTFTFLNGGDGYPMTNRLNSPQFGFGWRGLIEKATATWQWTGWDSTSLQSAFAMPGQLTHDLDGGGSGTNGAYDETDDFSRDFEWSINNLSGRKGRVGFFQKDASSSIVNSVSMYNSNGSFFVVINNTFSAAGATSYVINTHYFCRVSYTAGTNLGRLIVWSDSYDGTEIVNVTVARGGNTFDCDVLGVMSGLNSTALTGAQALYTGGSCAQCNFPSFTATSPTIYNRMNFFVDDANIIMSQIPIPFGGLGTVKEKYFASNTLLIPSESVDRATIDAGLNASFLTDPQRRAEANQAGRYLYRVFQLASDGTQSAWIDERCNLRAGNFVPAVAAGGGLIIHPGMGGGINA